jgi:hypothetical protein
LTDQHLGVGIPGDRDRKIDIPCEASLGARRDCQSSDDRSRMTRPIEVVDNSNKAALKLVHGEV